MSGLQRRQKLAFASSPSIHNQVKISRVLMGVIFFVDTMNLQVVAVTENVFLLLVLGFFWIFICVQSLMPRFSDMIGVVAFFSTVLLIVLIGWILLLLIEMGVLHIPSAASMDFGVMFPNSLNPVVSKLARQNFL